MHRFSTSGTFFNGLKSDKRRLSVSHAGKKVGGEHRWLSKNLFKKGCLALINSCFAFLFSRAGKRMLIND